MNFAKFLKTSYRTPLGRYFCLKTYDNIRKIAGIKHIEALQALKQEENKEHIKSVEGTFPKEMRTNEIKKEIDQIKKWEEKTKRFKI